MELKKFYYIECSKDAIFFVDLAETMSQGIAPIVWCNEGMFGLICVAKIKNMIQTLHDHEISEFYSPDIKVYWSETIQEPSEITKCLLTEISENKN